ncbi:MAG: hypothetical protein ABW061_15935 [Polyangiaceae bacterium]
MQPRGQVGLEYSASKRVFSSLASLASASLIGWLSVACGSSEQGKGGSGGGSPTSHAGTGGANGSSGSGPGATGGAGTTPGASGGGSTDMCPTDATDPTCTQCLDQKCCAPLLACSGDTQCTALVTCAAQCADDACITRCQTTYAAGATLSDALSACVTSGCDAECISTTPPADTDCQKGGQVFCYCTAQLGVGDCTQALYTSAESACTSGTPADVATAVKCGATYYTSDTVPPDCTAYATACFSQ